MYISKNHYFKYKFRTKYFKLKKRKMLHLVIFLSLCHYLAANPAPTETFTNHVILKDPSDYHLYWNFNDTDILFETHVKTTGWAAFGLSPTGGMDHSDVVVSWINSSGSYHFSDRHIRGTKVLIDKIQNWKPIAVFSKDGYLITKFSRKIKICDSSEEDLDIPSGTPFVIFAYSSNFANNDVTYHGSSRGTRAVPLISSISDHDEINMEEVETNDFRVNVKIYSFKFNINILKVNFSSIHLMGLTQIIIVLCLNCQIIGIKKNI